MMKKFLLSLMLVGVAMTANAQYQIANSNFDEWETVTGNGKTAEEPVHWNSFITASGSFAGTVAVNQMSKEVGRTGTGYCAKITARKVMSNIFAQGNLTTGQINGGSMSATDASGNYNYTNTANPDHCMSFTGRPDAVKVWVKFNGEIKAYPYGNVSVILHGNGYYQDPVANQSKLSELIAHAKATPANCDWTELIIPFKYYSANRPAYVLASCSTNAQPGQGTENDYLCIDDMELLYYSDIKEATYNGAPVTFSGTHAVVDDKYKEKFLDIVSGVAASIEYSFNEETYLLTITIKGDNFSEDPTNMHVYTVQFNGVYSSADDESKAVVTPETTVNSEDPRAGWFYIKNKQTGNYITIGTKTSATPHAWYLSANNGATINDADGKYIQFSKATMNCNINTSGTAAGIGANFNKVDGYYQIYGANVGFFDTYYAYINDSNGKIEKKGSASTADNYLWEFIPVNLYDRVNGFWKNYDKATLSNGVDAMAFVNRNASNKVDAQAVEDLPLGLYSINGGDVFYLPSGASLDIPANCSSLTYYGRIDLSMKATYDGAAIEPGSYVDAIYDASKLNITANGNGYQTTAKSFNAETKTLTVSVSGYGRTNEYEFTFAEPSMTLLASFFGDEISEDETVNEEYRADALQLTPGRGASVTNKIYNDGTLTVTITSVYGEEKSFIYHFMTYPQPYEGMEYLFDETELMAIAIDGVNWEGRITQEIGIEPLVNENYNINIYNFATSASNGDRLELGTLTAHNVKRDANGNLSFSDNVRAEDGSLVALSINAQLSADESELYAACTIVKDGVTTYYTYNISTVGSPVTYTDQLAVSINGDDAGAQEKTITLEYLNNGNVNFSLADFGLPGVMDKVGSINVNNVVFDEATGVFTYEGNINIQAGTTGKYSDWEGPKLGAVPVILRGQIKGGKMALVIDIDFREKLEQVIHVVFGCQPVSTKNFTEMIVVTVDGEPCAPVESNVTVGYLANGNVNFSLKNFALDGVGAVGDVSLDNLEMDESGNFTYNGSVFINKGDDANVETWLGPSLGAVPLELVGQIVGEGNDQSLIVTIDIQLPDQTVHVALGTTPVSYEDYVDELHVTVDGETTVQADTNIKVGYLKNGHINFYLNNFSLEGVGGVGNIQLDNLELSEDGSFTYSGVTRIGKGDDPNVDSWLGTSLGDVPLEMKGQIFTYGNKKKLVVTIDIQLSDQFVHVSYGVKTASTKDFRDDLVVYVNGASATTPDTPVQLQKLESNGYNFVLNDFVLGGGICVGDILIENLDIDADGKFSYSGPTFIAAGADESQTWLGPELGAVPLELEGQLYTFNGEEKLIVTINIDLLEGKDQYVHVTYGATPYRTNDYDGQLVVTVNKEDSDPIDATVQVGDLGNGNINFDLNNFMLNANAPVGNINLHNLPLNSDGSFSYNGVTFIGAGDDAIADYAQWLGPTLKIVPLALTGTLKNGELNVSIDIDMTETDLQQMIHVVFTGKADIPTLSNLVQLIKKVKEGQEQKANIQPLVNKLLGK